MLENVPLAYAHMLENLPAKCLLCRIKSKLQRSAQTHIVLYRPAMENLFQGNPMC